MNAKQRKAQQKREYDRMKDIRSRLDKGETTDYMERQVLKIYESRLKKKK